MNTQMPNQPSRALLMRDLSPLLEEQVAWYHHMQETQPIRYRPEYNLWEVFRYKDVQQVLLDSATFSADKGMPEGSPLLLSRTDPPDHRRFRSLVSQAFTPRRIQELAPRITEIVDDLLESAIARGKMDGVTGFASALPQHVIAEMLGLPLKDRERFQQWSYQLIYQFSIGVWTDNNELIQYFSDLLNERKRDPRDDLMSALLAAEENGTHLTRKEIISMCLELMLAGDVTSMAFLSRALHRLCQHPELYQALRDDPALIPGAIEEILRFGVPPAHTWRTALQDTVLNGQEIKAGQCVVIWTAAANFDETYFPHSERFDIRRSPNPHLTFSYGVHACLGSSLARLEGHIALERIVTRFSEVRLDPENPVQFIEQMGPGRFMRSLGMLFTLAGSC